MKKRVRKKISFLKILIIFLIVVILYVLSSYLLSIRTRNIIVLNNNYYSDQVIIENALLDNYPKFILLSKSRIKRRLKELELIEDVKVSKKFGFVLEIDVKEKKILYLIRSKNEYMLSDGNSYNLSDIVGIPTLINYVPEDIEKSFIKEFKKIDSNIISLISEIEYSKTSYDDKRFLLYMNDGNEVYITVTRINLLNKYIEIVKKLNNKNGILYLDSGNYFEIKE